MSTAMPTSASHLMLTVLLFLAYLISARCFTSPNPAPKQINKCDRIMTASTVYLRLFLIQWSIRVLGVYHAILTLFYPRIPPVMCPNAANLNINLFTWSPYSAVCLFLILTAGPLRLLAYAQLGKDFTYELRKPKCLVKTGLYRYMQHPSYTGVFLVLFSTVALLGSERGVLGCWLPAKISGLSPWLTVAQFACWVGIAIYGVPTRLQDEEGLLKTEFGKEWEEYCAKTARFIPGVL
ncbi:MAG: hypothetical protein M1830_008039 [Pleopsidium flavum]|nr:MAG: hypothetical protein M1830_008039 [Pleopsidium flavum]